MSRLILVNCCPHSVSYLDDAGVQHTLPAADVAARVEMTPGEIATRNVDQHQVRFTAPPTLGKVTGLPDARPSTVLIGSVMVAQQAAREGRNDVVSPDSGPTALRINGQVVAVRAFLRWSDAALCSGWPNAVRDGRQLPAYDDEDAASGG